ncbi:MAG: ComEC/Rec2 family competence protein [Alphaproteobacteria bacterium]
MAKFHFLNVKNGDCSIIEHNSRHISVIDICNARLPENAKELTLWEKLLLQQEAQVLVEKTGARKNYGQKAYPENPIDYMQRLGINNIFRLAITHPDMDHMDGLVDLFEYCTPTNYYDTKNTKEITGEWDNSPYREEDWLLYKKLRDNPQENSPKCMRIYSGDDGIHRLKDWNGNAPGDAFYTLAPTPELLAAANQSDDHNGGSYVFMYWSPAGKILLSGDSHDKTWEHILSRHGDLVKDVELLIAPHHGRKSGRSYEFLDVLKPKMTFFGNAPAKDLAYSAWNSRGLPYITNNMAGNMVVDCDNNMNLYVSNEEYARDENSYTFYKDDYGWYVRSIKPSESRGLSSLIQNLSS